MSMSPKYFCRFFSEMTHQTPMDYLNRQRIEQSCYELSTTDDSITEIAYRNGFNDLSYFIRTFKKYKGITPENIKIFKLLCCKYKGAPKRSFPSISFPYKTSLRTDSPYSARLWSSSPVPPLTPRPPMMVSPTFSGTPPKDYDLAIVHFIHTVEGSPG